MKVLYPSAFDAYRVVAVSQIVEHPALDAVRQGILDGLAEKGFKDGENLTFKFQTAQGKSRRCRPNRAAVCRRKTRCAGRHRHTFGASTCKCNQRDTDCVFGGY